MKNEKITKAGEKNPKFDKNGKLIPVQKEKSVVNDIPNKGKSKIVNGFKPEYRNKFANDIIKSIPDVTRVDSGDKVLLKLNNHLIVRLMLRKTHRFTAYRNTKEGRDSVPIKNDEDEAKLKTWIEQRVMNLKNKKNNKSK